MKLLVWVLLATVMGQQVTDTDSNQSPEPEQPSLELLTYLGSFETIDGDWIDPMSFEEQYETETKKQDHETHKDPISSPDPDPDAARLR